MFVTLDRLSWLAAVLVAAVFLAMLTPVCTMPSCDDTTAAGSCSDFEPACEQCPETLVMKHAPDDAVSSHAQVYNPPVVVAALTDSVEPAAVTRALDAPDATAPPPPLDPLGVRLTV